MLAIGIGAFFLRRRGYEMAPFVLGLVLGDAAGQEPAPRPGAVRRQPRALLHAADLRWRSRRSRSSRSCCTCRPFNARRRRAWARRGARSLFAPQRLRLERHEVRALQRGAAAAAVRASNAGSRRRSATTALEVAPFTLAADPMAHHRCAGARRSAASREDHGLQIFGLHWLLVAPAGPVDRERRRGRCAQRTVGVMQRLVELCALMGGRYLVHGSPKQRSVPPGETRAAGAGTRARMPRRAPRRGARAMRRHLLHRAAVARARPT